MLMHKADPVSDGLGYPKEMNFLKLIVQGNPQMDLQDKGVVDSGCLRHMIGNMSYLTGYKEIDGGYVAFGGNPKGGKITGKGTIKTGNLDFENVCDNKMSSKNRDDQFCERKGIKREFGVARTPQQNRVDERKNRTLIEAARTMLADSKLPTTFWLEAVNTACYKSSLGFMRPFGCPVTILNTIDHLGKFDSKANEGFFVVQKECDDVGDDEKKVTEELGKEGGDSSKDSLMLLVENQALNFQDDPNMPALEDIVYSDDDEDVGAEDGMNNVVIAIYAFRTKEVIQACKIQDEIEAIQDELLQFKLQKVWTLVDLLNGKRPIGTKWVFRNKKDERGIVIKNKARLVTQGYTQEEGIDYDETGCQSAFLYGKIEEEVYVCQPPGFEDPDFPNRVYKVEKALYGFVQALKAWYETLSTYLLDNGFQRGSIQDFVYQKGQSKAEGGWEFLFSQRQEFVDEILIKFGFTNVKTASTPMEIQNLLLKDEDGEEVDVHLYRSMIDYPFDLVAYTDSDYTGASLDRKSTTGGGGPRRQETIGDTIAQTRSDDVSKTSNDSLSTGVNTPQSDEDRLKLNELMEFCTKLQQRVLDLENTKTAQA
ncbi:retrovirus-related pol polyprotein from transposon TNT 1-94 [Tanacetum coccineum]